MRRVKVSLSIVALVALVAACRGVELDGSDEEVGSERLEIIGGNNVGSDAKYPYVVRLDIGGLCTGTLIAPSVVLTAAHCMEGGGGGTVLFGTGPSEFFEAISIDDVAIERQYNGTLADIALLRLAQPSTVTPIPYNVDFLTEDFVGTSVTTVGFGNNVAPTGGPETGEGAGTMREVIYAVEAVEAEYVNIGDVTESICQGDSGGPTFAMIDGERRVIAVSSRVAFSCLGTGFLTRTDRYSDFITAVTAAWDGPCAQDNVCDEELECEFLDPDCDICGYDGFCGDACETIDLDCELGGLAGAVCEDEFDCESRVCIQAPDDERVKYCSAVCDPSLSPADQCDIPLTRCGSTATDEDVCLFSGPTPGTQGAVCTGNNDCLGACDTSNGICVEACSSDADCSEEFDCRSLSGTKVCTLPEDGGCCSTTSAPPKPFNLLLTGFTLLGLLLVSRRRRLGPSR